MLKLLLYSTQMHGQSTSGMSVCVTWGDWQTVFTANLNKCLQDVNWYFRGDLRLYSQIKLRQIAVLVRMWLDGNFCCLRLLILYQMCRCENVTLSTIFSIIGQFWIGRIVSDFQCCIRSNEVTLQWEICRAKSNVRAYCPPCSYGLQYIICERCSTSFGLCLVHCLPLSESQTKSVHQQDKQMHSQNASHPPM